MTTLELPKDAPAPPRTMSLWPAGAAELTGADPTDIPTITLFTPPPAKSTGAAIIVCPGGAYSQHTACESEPVAAWLARLGITSVLLRYRLGPRNTHPAPLQDVARSIKMTRALAGRWKIDPNRVGIMGFSAGGHLASTLCTHFTDGERSAPDPVDRFSSRPDLCMLIYPIITLCDPHAHVQARRHLLGENPPRELIDYLSNDKQVSRRTPSTFLFHTVDDATVAADNSIAYAGALRKNGIPFEMHLYETGPHGIGLASGDPHVSTWPALCARWLANHGFSNAP